MTILIIISVIGMAVFMYAGCKVAGDADRAEEKMWHEQTRDL